MSGCFEEDNENIDGIKSFNDFKNQIPHEKVGVLIPEIAEAQIEKDASKSSFGNKKMQGARGTIYYMSSIETNNIKIIADFMDKESTHNYMIYVNKMGSRYIVNYYSVFGKGSQLTEEDKEAYDEVASMLSMVLPSKITLVMRSGKYERDQEIYQSMVTSI
ncbi:hypothetical protein [Methanococcus voltae]|uniref:Uncharacterized protein n=2 Tax=Methanococcus voltae TaxID=2188 RepID=A0A8J7URS2_METVO|nr:hypothetical protein [Methanococcus voltae]MBP2172136.1 hypothetical protein [Methanococcus voltae]MBP2200907.1 hypothetical protein [Methanococcus voltae]MCS3921631.1 hypothetical protein [Methanococcus voltae PS]